MKVEVWTQMILKQVYLEENKSQILAKDTCSKTFSRSVLHLLIKENASQRS